MISEQSAPRPSWRIVRVLPEGYTPPVVVMPGRYPTREAAMIALAKLDQRQTLRVEPA